MGILKNEIMRTYNMRPSTAERCMEILEAIDNISKREYERGFADGREPTWIPVAKKSHPSLPVRVQVQMNNGWIITAYYDDEWFIVPCGQPLQDDDIVAWKPLPEPWKGENVINGQTIMS